MAYDHAEQEQLDSLKAWWQRYGMIISIVVIVLAIALIGWKGWNVYQRNQASQASQLFEEQAQAVETKDVTKALRAADDIQAKFGGTTYASLASLVAAKEAVAADKSDDAKKYLNWVLNNSKYAEYKALAATRLSGILLDEKSYDDALKALSGTYPEQFVSLLADRRGDILLAQGKRDEARAAYQEALSKAVAQDPAKELIQLKLDSIGGAV